MDTFKENCQEFEENFENHTSQNLDNNSTYDNTSTSLKRAHDQLIPPGTPVENNTVDSKRFQESCYQDGSFQDLYSSAQVQRIYRALVVILLIKQRETK